SGFFSRIPPASRRSMAESSTTSNTGMRNPYVSQRSGDRPPDRSAKSFLAGLPGRRKGSNVGQKPFESLIELIEKFHPPRQVPATSHFFQFPCERGRLFRTKRPQCTLESMGCPADDGSIFRV